MTDRTVMAPLPPSHLLPAVPALPRARRSRGTSVCLYTPSADPSGMGAHLLELAAELLPHGDVTVMAWPTAPGARLLERAAGLGATAVALRHPRDPRFGPEIRAHLLRSPVDVFHVHVGFGREDFDGARAARRAGVRAVVQTQHLPWLLGSHKHRRPFFRGLREVDHVITVSDAQQATYARIGVPRERMTTVPNGIRSRGAGPGRAAARRALGLAPDARVVLTVGRLVAMKGQRHLLDAVPALAAGVADLAVVVVGDGHLARALQTQAAALGVRGRVHLAGHRPDARMLLDAADVFVLPSLTEGMPLALLEAMDAGLPVVATRVIGSEEVVEDGVTGLLVPPRDPPALAAALGALLADPALAAAYGAAGRRRYRELFTAARMGAQTREVHARVLAADRGGRHRARLGVTHAPYPDGRSYPPVGEDLRTT